MKQLFPLSFFEWGVDWLSAFIGWCRSQNNIFLYAASYTAGAVPLQPPLLPHWGNIYPGACLNVPSSIAQNESSSRQQPASRSGTLARGLTHKYSVAGTPGLISNGKRTTYQFGPPARGTSTSLSPLHSQVLQPTGMHHFVSNTVPGAYSFACMCPVNVCCGGMIPTAVNHTLQ